MTFSVSISHRQGAFALEAEFESNGRLTALFGASGSGKTTLVNIIGGLVRPNSGRVETDGRVLVDTKRRLFVPPHRRDIGYVFQDARLFPHLSVRQNLKYGRFFTPQAERYAEFDAVVDMLGIAHLLERRPAMLSGGEKQRVAIGRALIASPKLILMDEPLASLDDARKAEILPYIERLRDHMRIPIVYVSHSLAEVSRLATDVVHLAGGRVLKAGTASEVLTAVGWQPKPDDAMAGGGTFSLVEMEVVGDEPSHGLSVLRSSAGEWRLSAASLAKGARVRARIDADDVIVATERPRGISALNIIDMQIDAIADAGGGRLMLELRSGSDRLLAGVTRRSAEILDLRVGGQVFAIVKSVAIQGMPMAVPRPQLPVSTFD
jgi:molybdate transport system ATP-binding protein